MSTNHVHDLEDDAPRYVAEALKITGRDWVSVDTLIDNYDLPRPNNIDEIRASMRGSVLGSERPTVYDVTCWLIREALSTIKYANEWGLEVTEDEQRYRLAEDTDAEDLKTAAASR